MGSDLPRLLHPDSEPGPPSRSAITLPPLAQLDAQPPASAASAAASSASTSCSQFPAFATPAAESRVPPLTPPPSSTLNSPPPPSTTPTTAWTAVNQNHSVISPGEHRNGSEHPRGLSSHPPHTQHRGSSQAIPASADPTQAQSEQNKPCAKQFRGASISYILSSASPSSPGNSHMVTRPRTPPPSVLSPPPPAQTKESDSQSHRAYNTPPSPAQTPKTYTQTNSHGRGRSVHFPPGTSGTERMPPPRSPQRHHSTGPEGVVPDSYESGSTGDSSTPRHSSSESDDRGSSAPPPHYMVPAPVSKSDNCTRCRLLADAKLVELENINATYAAQPNNGEKTDLSRMESFMQDFRRTVNNRQYDLDLPSCPHCHHPPPQPVRNNYLGESSPRPNKRKSPSCISGEHEESCFKARRTTPEDSISRTAEEAFGLLPALPGSRHTWTSQQGPQPPGSGVEAD